MPSTSPPDKTSSPRSNQQLPIARNDEVNAPDTTTEAFSGGSDDQRPETRSLSIHDDLLYALTPYLTCQRCNCVTFIDVQRVRRKADQLAASMQPLNDADEREDTTPLYEQVPKCPGCGSTRYLRAGVVSFQEQIEEERNAIKEFERRRVPATALLQRIARGFFGRLEFHRRLLERGQVQHC